MGYNSGIFVAVLIASAFAPCYGQETGQPKEQPAPKPPAKEPYIIEDGGISLQASTWLLSGEPSVRPGKLATAGHDGTLNYSGKRRLTPGFMLSVPAGKQNTLRFSYFQMQRTTNVTAAKDVALFSVGYNSGDYLAADYKVQNVKASWDYLSYTVPSSKLRIKTLWELQYTSIKTTINAPLKVQNGTQLGYGSKWVVLPSLGMGLEHAPSRHFRWEAKASGFGIPRRAAIWDAEATGVLRLGHVEVLFGGKAWSVKTSPKDDVYFKQMLYGPYVGLRLSWDPTM